MKTDLKTEFHRYHRYFIDLREFTQRKEVRSFTNLTLSLLTISFFAFFAIKPTLIIIAKLTKEIKDKQEIRTKLQKKIASLVKAQEVYSLNENRFYLLDQALPNIPDFPSLIFPLEKQASVTNVGIKSFTITKIELVKSKNTKTKNLGTPAFSFNLSATGDYQSLEQFLGKIDRLRRLITIEKISFGQTKKAKEESNLITLIISGSSSFYPGEAK